MSSLWYQTKITRLRGVLWNASIIIIRCLINSNCLKIYLLYFDQISKLHNIQC